jgi:protein-S-isoprenylcysteine O-methyltransferase Ste14
MKAMHICAILWIVFYTIWLLAALSNKRTRERASGSRTLGYFIPVVLAYWLMFGRDYGIPWLQYGIVPRTPTIDIAAVAITLAGMLFAIWARIALGRNWSSAPTIKEDHRLIRSGPYHLVRHPIYSGFLLAMFGTFLANGRVRGALSVILLWFAWTAKSRIEEEFMVRTFGPEYEDYRRTTGALFPRLLG